MHQNINYLTVLKRCFLLVLIIIVICLAWLLVVEYREQKILRVTFDHSDYYKSLTSGELFGKEVVVLFGDSRIKQWRPLPKIEGMKVVNRGVSEETTAQMKLRFKKDVLDIEPNIVIIQAGINDLVAASMAGHDLKSRIYNNSIINIRAIVEQAVQQEITVILFKIIEPYELGFVRSVLWGNDLPHLVRQANDELLTLSDEPGVYIFNANKVLHQEGQWEPGVNRDALHFTAKAYQLLNGEVTQLITTISK